MARVKYSPIIDSINGKIANVVFQDGKAGAIVRNRVVPANPNTAAQANARGILSLISKSWAALSDAQRTSWDTAAASPEWRQTNAYGEGFQLSGEQLFIKLNSVIEFVQESTLTSPPSKATFDSITIGALTAAAGTPALSLAFSGTLSSNFQFNILASPQVSQGNMSSKSVRFSSINTTSGTTPINLLSAYTNKFGTLVAGKKIFVKLEIISDLTGEVLFVGETSAIVAA